MYKKYIENLQKNTEVRQSLIELKKMLKSPETSAKLTAELCSYTDILRRLLSDADAKVRKNTALIMAELAQQESLDDLLAAYEEETTLFVRPAYLQAIGELDYRSACPVLEKRLDVLNQMEIAPEDRKHLSQERHLLSELLGLLADVQKHEYTKKPVASRVFLTTRKGRENLLLAEIHEKFPQMQARQAAGGVLVGCKNVQDLFTLRTWQNMLFAFAKENVFEKDGEAIARGLSEAGLLDYLQKRHEAVGTDLWRFRIDVHTKDDQKMKTVLARQTAAALEQIYAGTMVNSVSDYEFELLLMPRKDGRIAVWLKLHTLCDRRFAYRENFVAASMNPVNAAQVIYACKDDFKENANVLDPFCGVGTLLIERRMCCGKNDHVRGLYGVDTFGQAIDGGRKNADRLGCPVNFIQRDFFDFTHRHLFDEVITDMPEQFASMAACKAFYKRFLEKICGHVADDGRLFIYSTNGELIRDVIKAYPQLTVRRHIPFSEKTGACVIILGYRKLSDIKGEP